MGTSASQTSLNHMETSSKLLPDTAAMTPSLAEKVDRHDHDDHDEEESKNSQNLPLQESESKITSGVNKSEERGRFYAITSLALYSNMFIPK